MNTTQFQLFKESWDRTFQTNSNLSNITKFIRKKKFKYMFKRGSDRLMASTKKEFIYLQSIFSSRILTAIYHNEFIINVDGSIFSRSVRNNYSWLPKDKSFPILNTLWKESSDILLALSIDGAWFWMILNENNTHFIFWVFLFFL